ncbi:MAG: PhoH family protein [Micrococcales bacterium]|nr:PhoH family protein [Micrococcales bacterium]MBT5431393.1 PhoH family protein [Micrococcales bacterium]MBT5847830.1 PhoH family protein [Micrococcales bacterium]MBT7926022.1 PhoH family protein [Micrococcales bacterium]
MASSKFQLPEIALIDLLGQEDKNLRRIESDLQGLKIQNRGHEFTLTGEDQLVQVGQAALTELVEMVRQGLSPSEHSVSETIKIILEGKSEPASKILAATTIRTPAKTIRAKTSGQKTYLDSIDENTITFGIGPAGTGKTYLAVAKAVEALYNKEVSRIILTRPAVEAGEKLGFLPGTLSEKIDPYLRPLFDSLQEMLEPEVTAKMMDAGVIEVAPLAYMRGRTLNDSFIILDEAQNTTGEQMKMFLTRLGFNSKMVITGDVTQIDLPGGNSGLRIAQNVLADVEGLHISHLSSRDVVRHELVTRIIDAYDLAATK